MPRVNSCLAPSAAVDVTGHRAQSAITRVTGQAGPPRSTGAQITAPATAYGGYFDSAGAVGAAGQTWSAVTWLWSEVARPVDVAFLGWSGSNVVGGTETANTRVQLAAGTWTPVRYRAALAGSGFDQVRFHVNFPTAATAGLFRMGSTRLEQVDDAALDFADGDTSSWQWDGPAGASTSQETPPPATENLVEDFEDTTYAFPITGNWSRSTTRARTGSWSLRSATITHNQTSNATVTAPTGATAVRFWYSVSSERGSAGQLYDGIEFLINGVRQFRDAGEITWTQTALYPVTAGDVLTFRYYKDASASAGSDAAWIDDLVFTVPVTGPTVHQAAATLSGGGALTASPLVTRRATTALAGGGGVTSDARTVRPAVATQTAGGALSVAATPVRPAAATLSGGGGLAAVAGHVAAAQLSAGGALAAAGRQTHVAAAALTAGGAVGVAARQGHSAVTGLAAGGALTTSVTRVRPAAAALNAGGALVAAGTRVKVGLAVLAGGGALVVGYVLRTAVVQTALSGGGTLFARGHVTAGGALNPTVWALDPLTGRLVPLPHVVKLQVDDVANDVGAVTIDYPVWGKNWELLAQRVTDERDLEVEVWLEGARATRMVGRLDQRQGDDVTEGAVWSFSGTLITGRLDEGLVAPQPLVGETTLGPDVEVTQASVTGPQWSRFYALGYRTSESEPGKIRAPQKVVDAVKANKTDIPQLADPKREAKFAAATPGAIMAFLLGQCWARGALSDLTVDFTAAKDSAGQPWPEVLTAKWSPGVTLLQVAQRLVELGLMEFTVSPDRVLRCWRFGGRGTVRTAGPRPVTLRRGENLLQAGRRQGSRSAGTDFHVAGGEGAFTTSSDLNARAARGRMIERSSSVGNITDPGALAAAAQRTRTAGVRGEDERSFALALGVGMPRPGKDLAVADTVRVDTAGTLGTARVAQWTVALDAGSQMPAAQVTCGDLIRSRAAALAKRLQDQQSGETVVGTSQPSEDRGVPDAPDGLVVGSAAFLEGQDVYAAVTAGWAEVAVNTDGTATTDLASYRVEWRLESTPDAWQAGAEVDAQRTSASWTVAPATPIRVRVQAIDRSGNRSVWSDEVLHLTEDDATPPSVPSVLVGSDYLGTARWTWDGKTVDGADMAAAFPDFSHVELWMGASAAFADAVLVTNLYARGTWTIADLAYGTTQYAWLVAVDLRGNRSGQSGRAQATPGRVAQVDLGPNAVGRAEIIDAAIGNAQIDNLAVNNAKIADLSVGKLTAGTMSADVIVAGIFRTALTGGRTEFDNAGIRGYDPTGALRLRWQNSDGSLLVTGEYRSAMTGKRFQINSLGSNPDEIRFYPSATNMFARLKTLNSVSTTYDGQAGIVMKGYSPRGDGQSGEVAVFPGHARLSWGNEMGDGVVSSSIGAEKHQVGIGAPRITIGAQSATGEVEDSIIRIGILNNAGTALVPAATVKIDNKGSGGLVRVMSDSPSGNCGLMFVDNGGGTRQSLISVVSENNSLLQIAASNVQYSSSIENKEAVEDFPFDPVAVVRGVKARRYERRSDRKLARNGHAPAAPKRLGLIAEELPTALQEDLGPHGLGVGAYELTATLWEALRREIQRADELQQRVGTLEAGRAR